MLFLFVFCHLLFPTICQKKIELVHLFLLNLVCNSLIVLLCLSENSLFLLNNCKKLFTFTNQLPVIFRNFTRFIQFCSVCFYRIPQILHSSFELGTTPLLNCKSN